MFRLLLKSPECPLTWKWIAHSNAHHHLPKAELPFFVELSGKVSFSLALCVISQFPTEKSKKRSETFIKKEKTAQLVCVTNACWINFPSFIHGKAQVAESKGGASSSGYWGIHSKKQFIAYPVTNVDKRIVNSL